MRTQQECYMNYNTMVSAVENGVKDMAKACDSIEMNDRAEELRALQKRLNNHLFSVGVLGEFRRGKSTVINALLGEEIVPSDIVPTSATLNYVRWDVRPHADINFKDGTGKEVPVNELAAYVTKTDSEKAAVAQTVRDAVVYYPCRFCQNGVQIVDTPGLNDDERMTAITEEVVPKLDAIIFVLTADSPFSDSEANFVRNKIMMSDISRVIFVLNKIDIVRPKDRQRLIDNIHERIREYVLEKIEAVYGKDSRQFTEAEDKLKNVRLFPVSALQALDAKQDGDAQALEKSGFLELEHELAYMLTEERGMLQLMAPVNQLMNTAESALRTIDMRTNSISMDKTEFEKIQTESLEEIKKTRARKVEEINRLKKNAATLKEDMLALVPETYDKVRADLCNVVGCEHPTPEELGSNKGIEEFGKRVEKKVQEELNNKLSFETDCLMMRIRDRIGEELVHCKKFTDAVDYTARSVESNFKNGSMATNIAIIGIDTVLGLTSPIGFIGGAIQGWRNAGVGGAVVGGIGGFVAGAGALGAIIASGGLLIPAAVVGCAVASLTGKGLTSLVFGKRIRAKKAADVRDALQNGVDEMIQNMRRERVLENWLTEVCHDVYAQLMQQLNNDTEVVLSEMEAALRQSEIDLNAGIQERERLIADMTAVRENVREIVAAIAPVQKKLKEFLNLPNTSEA